MPTHIRFMSLIPMVALIGCTLPATTSPSNPTSTGEWTNWQIQGGSPNPTPPIGLTSPPTGTYLVGALQIVNSNVTGVFTTNVVTGGGTGVVDMTGAFDSSTSVFALDTTPAYLMAQLTVPSGPNTLATGTLDISCPPLPPGGACTNLSVQLPVVGTAIAPLSGAYTGTLTDSADPSMSGTGTLTLTQSTTPNASGAFPLAGTLTFPASSGLGTYPISGTISGEGITLYDPTPGVVPVVSLTASSNPAGTQITVSDLAFAVTASDIVTFTGTLTLQ